MDGFEEHIHLALSYFTSQAVVQAPPEKTLNDELLLAKLMVDVQFFWKAGHPVYGRFSDG